MRRRTFHWTLVLPAVAAWSMVLAGCRPTVEAPPEQPPAVTVARPVVANVVDYAEFTGRLQSTETVQIRARVQGFLESAEFVDGDEVEEGQLLFVIEKEPFEAEEDAAEAKIKQAEASVALATANENRARQLIERDAISQEEYQTRAAEKAAADAQLLAAQAELRQAEINLGYTDIKAPFAGRASEKLVDPGNLVGASESTLLTTVSKLDPLYAYFDVSEDVVSRYLRKKMENPDWGTGEGDDILYIGLPDEEGFPHEAKIEYFDSTIDPSTGTAMARATVNNPDRLLYPGNFVRLRMPRAPQENAVLVHEEALGTDLGGKYLWVVDAQDQIEEEPRRVELGTLIKGMRVITSGIGPEDRYIVKGLHLARPGRQVAPEMAPAQAPPVAPEPITGSATESTPAAPDAAPGLPGTTAEAPPAPAAE